MNYLSPIIFRYSLDSLRTFLSHDFLCTFVYVFLAIILKIDCFNIFFLQYYFVCRFYFKRYFMTNIFAKLW